MPTVFESLLNNTFSISRSRRTPDGRGGWAVDYVEIGTARGRIRPASSSERESAAQEQRLITHVLYLPAGTDVARGDRVTLGALVVDVEGIREPSRAGHHLEIDCREVQLEESLEEGS